MRRRHGAVRQPEPLRWNEWTEGQLGKVYSGLAWIESAAPVFGERVDIGTIAIGCALGYMDFRFPAIDWRAKASATARWFDGFNQRPSMQATLPQA